MHILHLPRARTRVLKPERSASLNFGSYVPLLACPSAIEKGAMILHPLFRQQKVYLTLSILVLPYVPFLYFFHGENGRMREVGILITSVFKASGT